MYIIKLCSRLGLTYQIKLATLMAVEKGLQVKLAVRDTCVVSAELDRHLTTHKKQIKLERIDGPLLGDL